MEHKLEIINRMVANGYQLMGRTAQDFAAIFTETDLLDFEKNFMEWRKAQ